MYPTHIVEEHIFDDMAQILYSNITQNKKNVKYKKFLTKGK